MPPRSRPDYNDGMTATHSTQPDALGRFGDFGGSYIPETLHAAVDQLADEYAKAQADPAFRAELEDLLRDYVGRATPFMFAENLTKLAGGAQIAIADW